MTFLHEIRLALRMLGKNLGLTTLAVLAFTLGLGLVTIMFSIVHGALRKLPFEEADRLLHLERNQLSRNIESMEVTLHDFLDWREQQTSFEGLAAFTMTTVNLAGDGEKPERYFGAAMTANSFGLLGGTAPVLGRDFRAGEDQPGAEPVVILGHHVWQGRFGKDSAILGKTVRLNGEPTTVIGVMPEGFKFPFNQDVWTNLILDPTGVERGEGTTLEVYGRLRDGVSRQQAAAEMSAIAQGLAEHFPDTNEGVGAVVKPYTEEFVGREAIALLSTMLAAVFGVLLIACANVAHLLLARTATRGKEVAIRSALGASRLAVMRPLLTEALVLAALGALGGLIVAAVGIELFNAAIVGTNPPYWLDIRIDTGVLLFVLGMTLAATLASGLLPALRASGEGMNEVLKDESRGSSGLRMGRLSKGLVIGEIALSCGLLVAAGLMIKTVVNLRNADFGIAMDDVFTARITLSEREYPDAAARQRLYAELGEQLGNLPGVRAAALASFLPVGGSPQGRFAIEGEDYDSPQAQPITHYAYISPRFFETCGAPILAGRDFNPLDREGELPVALVNRPFVDRYFSGKDPLGRRLRLGGPDTEEPWVTIVGIVPDLAIAGHRAEDPSGIYFPLAQSRRPGVALLARTAGPPMALTQTVTDAVAALDPNLPLYNVRTMREVVRQNTWFYGVFGSLFMAFGIAALFLAGAGLYGVMAFSVSRRTHEVGIRMALGAQASQVLGMILRQGGWQIGAGIGLGLGLAALLARAMKIVLFQVEPWDPWTFLAIVGVLAATGFVACLVPARRASRLSPLMALRQD